MSNKGSEACRSRSCRSKPASAWTSPAEAAWLEAVRVYRESDRPDEAIRTAEAALEEHSQSLHLHTVLGQLLIEQGDLASAAKHLQWASVNAPDDAALKQLAANTLKESLRHQAAAERESSIQRR